MVELGLIGGLVLMETLGYRRATFGRPPTRPLRLYPSAFISLAIHIGFHAAATVMPSVATSIAFVLAGWATFFFWWKWVSRAPDPWGFEEGNDGGGGGGGGGGPGIGPDNDGEDPGGGGREIDWEEREREMSDLLTPGRTLVGSC